MGEHDINPLDEVRSMTTDDAARALATMLDGEAKRVGGPRPGMLHEIATTLRIVAHAIGKEAARHA